MDSHSVLLILRHHKPELKAAGISHLRLFGSVARGNSSPRLQPRLSDLLGANVDLSAPEWMREPIRTQALAKAILAF